MTKRIMALDQGTSSSRTVLFNEKGNILAASSQTFDAIYPHPGWVEQDPEAIWQSQKKTMVDVLSETNLTMADITAIGITNQRETVIAWDRETGEAVGNAIVWQCRRTADFCDELKSEGFEEIIRQKTGLLADPYFSGTKIRWMLNELPPVRELANQQKLAFGTVDSWLIWKLSGGKDHVTDVSNASRTMLYNIFDLTWDAEIIDRFDIPMASLPDVKGSSEIISTTNAADWGASVPIAGVAGDQQAALFGQACFEKGMAKNTYGTGCFLLMNTGEQASLSQHGLLTTIAWKIGAQTTYALEGSAFIAGALIQWLRDNLGLFFDAAETEAMANAVDDTGGAYIVPAFVGLGAPYWDPHARGTMIGLTRDTNKNHLARAALEAIAYQSWDLLSAMEKDTGTPLKLLRVDGGATANNFLCQFQADILQLNVSRPNIIETTAMGAAFLAGLSTGVWESLDQIQSMWQENRLFSPSLDQNKIDSLLKGWHKALERTRS